MIYYFGAHMSIKNSIISSIRDINKLGGNFLQIFISNPRGKSSPKKSIMDDSEKIKSELQNLDTKIVIHLPYIINIGKQFNKNNWWIKMIIEQLYVSEQINSLGCVIHTGKYTKNTIDDGLNNMYKSLIHVIEYLKKNNMRTKIILETSTGQGTELLSNLDEFADFYNKFTDDEKNYLKICIDTCHIFVAGYDIRTKNNVKIFFKYFEKIIGIKNVILVHLNDSKKKCGSCVDRHENIGNGFIGNAGLKEFIRLSFFYHLPIILETPDSNNFINEIQLINDIKNKFIH